MKLTCKRGVFHETFQLAASVASTKTVKSIFQNVKIEAGKGKVELVARNYDISIRLEADDVEVERPGTALVPAARTASILRELPDDVVTLDATDGACIVSGEHAKFRILCDVSEEFPEVGSFEDEPTFEIKRENLRDMIHKTVFATAHDSTRYSLNGVFLVVKGAKATMVATDGRRMAKVTRKVEKVKENPPNVIIPTNALAHLERLAVEDDEQIAIKVQERDIWAKVKRGTLIARLVDGHFPPYDEVIPKDCDKRVVLPKQQLLRAVRQAALVTTEETRVVEMEFASNVLNISASSSDAGEARVDMPIEYDGEGLTAVFNPQFLEDVLKVADGETITMALKDARTQVLIEAGENYQYVVMPVIRSTDSSG